MKQKKSSVNSEVSAIMAGFARKRWERTTPEQRSKYGKMMVEAREAKRAKK